MILRPAPLSRNIMSLEAASGSRAILSMLSTTNDLWNIKSNSKTSPTASFERLLLSLPALNRSEPSISAVGRGCASEKKKSSYLPKKSDKKRVKRACWSLNQATCLKVGIEASIPRQVLDWSWSCSSMPLQHLEAFQGGAAAREDVPDLVADPL